MSRTTYPPKAPVTMPSKADIRTALRIVRKHKIDWWNPWPDEVSDNTIRYLRREGYVATFKASGGVQTAGNPFGYHWVEDEITDKGREWLREARARR